MHNTGYTGGVAMVAMAMAKRFWALPTVYGPSKPMGLLDPGSRHSTNCANGVP